MRLLAGLLLSFLLAFPIPVIVVEKELFKESFIRKTYRKVKLYIAKGYEREEIEEESVYISKLPEEFLRMYGIPGKTKYRMRAVMLIHFKKGKVFFYSPNDQEKNYTEDVLPGDTAVLESLGPLACDGIRECRLKVEPTDEWKELNGWKARKVVLKAVSNQGAFTTNRWYTRDSKLLLEAERLHMGNLITAVGSRLENLPSLKGILNALGNILRDYGAPVMEEYSDGVDTTREVVKSVRKVDLPESFFHVPEGYRKVGR